MFYFSLNSPDLIPVVKEKVKLLDKLKRCEIMFLCMYGYNTTLSDDIKRFSFIQKMGILPFVQEYQLINNKPAPAVDNYFDTDMDPLLTICFHQNGRNFERFLHWVSKKYVEQFGSLHLPLVDLIYLFSYGELACLFDLTLLKSQ